MATTSGPTEEIIEKKASAPVATACLIIACVALLGAIAFEIAEIAGYRSGGISAASENPGQEKAKNYIKKLKADVEQLLTQDAPGATASGTEGSMDADSAKPSATDAADADAADADAADADAPEAAPKADAADEPAADEPAADEPAADEPAADEPAEDEPAADEPAEDEPAADDSSS